MKRRIPFLRPRPPHLSELRTELRSIEDSSTFTNYGPVNTRLEEAIATELFGSLGGCLTVNNATIGLMLSIRECIGETRQRRYALLPSFTFAATAHAAIWAGLTPLLCDIDPHTWLPSARSEDELLRRYAGEVAVMVPYATFGNCLDLARYGAIEREHGIPAVVDAAASLGSHDEYGRNFGAGFHRPVIYSMHATKTFATAEAGLIYCNDAERLGRLRVMGNFGLGQGRSAIMPGLNSKLSEIGALLGLSKLQEFESVVAHRNALADAYRAGLPADCAFQRSTGARMAYQFMPVLLPARAAGQRNAILARLADRGVGAASYFSPHLVEQPYFARTCVAGDLSTTRDIASRVLSLPMSDTMTLEDVDFVCDALAEDLRIVA